MLNHVTRRKSLLAILLVVGMLGIGASTVAGFATVGAAALQQSYEPAGATGTGVNAPPAGSQPLYPGKWDAQNYRIPHHVASCPQPPATAQARLALVNSPTLLQYYGLPTLAQVGNLAEWQKIVTHDQTRQCDYTTPYRDGKPITHGRPTTAKATTSNSLTPQPLTNGSTPNSIWGGFGAMWCNGCWAFQGMQGEYPVSSIDICYTKCDVSIWAGVGGAINNETLVQAGVSQDSTTGTITGYYGFYEYAPGGKEQDWWNVSSMDSMWSAAYQNGAVYDSDFTQNKYASTNVGVSSSNDSAEFIVERNGMSNCNNWPFYCVALANYHDYSISNVKYQLANTNWYNPDSSMENFWVWNLKNSSGQMLESNIGYYDYSGGASWVENWLQGS